jgi:hypothetical protein
MVVLALAAAMLNSQVTPQTIHETICLHGWSAHHRPSASYVIAWKKAHHAHRGEIADHRIPIALGGASKAPNLQLQTRAEAARKDRLERQLHAAVCSGRVGLREAQERMEAWRP